MPPKLLDTLDSETLSLFVEQVQTYGSISAAAGRAKIARRNVEKWLQLGRQAIEAGTDAEPGSEVYAAFAEAVDVARGVWEADQLDTLKNTTSNARIKATTFQLERLMADTYRLQVEQTGDQASRLMIALQTRGKAIAQVEVQTGSASLPADATGSPRTRKGWLGFDSPDQDWLMLPEDVAQPSDGSSPDGADDQAGGTG